ncbi:hypothetical protein BCE75_102336 [Isoptericola sp. CG 20/1183]|uniref:Integral membrane protein n=1 Tax=Isoptericola halotolerans TaxID=300560 RepID=A0ABX5EJC4_9MICO|nr:MULTISPECIES: hypothetical protein [Isoptericola]PRZ09622.1 hypothetical protein BCE75_102336 [Isoptericola sp. CG 20/1183]PRZ10423.1 hypothetical protein BCL65_101568 [Isoptericola halotolerans]
MRSAPALDVLPVRALLVGSTSLAMATAAHSAAGGGTPRSALAVAVLVGSVLPAAVALGRGALTLPRLLPVLGLLQVLLHAELSVLASHVPHAPHLASPGPSGHAAHGAAPAPVAVLGADAVGVTAAGAGHGAGGVLMVAAHVVAVVLVAAVLASGDRAARWVVTWMSSMTLLVRTATLPVARRRPAAVVVDRLVGARALRRLLTGGLRFRGPPGAARPGAPANLALGAA